MKKPVFLCVCASVMVLACSTAPKVDDAETTMETTTETTKTTPQAMLDVHEVVIVDPDKGDIVRVDADGSVVVTDADSPLAGHFITITPAGTITTPDGALLYTLGQDGAIAGADGAPLGIVVEEDGTCSGEGVVDAVTFDGSGDMLVNKGKVGVRHVGGEDSPRARRALSFMFVGLTTHGADVVSKEIMRRAKEREDEIRERLEKDAGVK